MSFCFETDEQYCRLTLQGEVGFDDLHQLVEEAREQAQSPRETVVDLSEVEWMHFACFQAVLAFGSSVQAQGKSFSVIPPAEAFADEYYAFGLSDHMVKVA